MPTYCFKLPSGQIIEKVYPMSAKRPTRLKVGDQYAIRDFNAEGANPHGMANVHARASDALGVHPRQVPAMQALLKRRGCRDTQFDSTGACIILNESHETEVHTARGSFNPEGGYSGKSPGLAQVVMDNV